MTRRPLTTTKDQFNQTHAALDKARTTTTLIGVDRAALTALLADHSYLAARYATED